MNSFKRVLIGLIAMVFGLVVGLVAGCKASKGERAAEVYLKDVLGPELESGTEYLLELRSRGLLGGVLNDAKGELKWNGVVDDDKQAIYYPEEFTYDAVYNGKPFVIHYTVRKETNGSPWTLTRAWKADMDGKVLEEYPTK